MNSFVLAHRTVWYEMESSRPLPHKNAPPKTPTYVWNWYFQNCFKSNFPLDNFSIPFDNLKTINYNTRYNHLHNSHFFDSFNIHVFWHTKNGSYLFFNVGRRQHPFDVYGRCCKMAKGFYWLYIIHVRYMKFSQINLPTNMTKKLKQFSRSVVFKSL